jgi:hypothetical protein
MKKLLLLVLMTAFVNTLFSQDRKSRKEERIKKINAIAKQEEEGVMKYTKHLAMGFKLNNDGYGGFAEVGRAQSLNRSLLYQLEISERKNSKEEKFQDEFGLSAPIIYGKINFFYPVKLGVQQQFLFGNKGNKNGVNITGNFGGGISLGLLRPYLVQVDKGNGTYEMVGYNSADSGYFLNGPIIAGPTITDGWSKLKCVPGFYLKPSVRFDYGKYNEMLTAIEIGVTAEYYTKKIEQMIYISQKQLFLGAYVAVVFGRRK